MARDETGAVVAEYGVVIVLVGVIMIIALASIGLPLFQHLVYAEAVLGLPVP